MSFNFSSLTRNQMQTVVPLMSNITNGTNFMPQLAVAAAQAAAAAAGTMPPLTAGPSLLPSHLSAGLNDNPLEFKTTTNNLPPSSSSNLFNKNSQDKNLKNNGNQLGAGPMDLENENENLNNLNENHIKKSLVRDPRKLNIGGGGSNGGDDDNNGTKSILMGNDMFLNGIMGVGPPSHNSQFMMMPGMMMDPAMAATLQMQQFPLMAAATAAATIPQTAVTSGTSQTNTQNIENNSQQLIPVQIKEIITCKSCTLYPPNPNAPPPTIRERPPGCRTVFVGGLPEKTTEEILREIFERCGEITTLRLSKKNFCHIRFVFEASVDSAIYLSGYRLRIANSSEPSHCGRLHVDYAQARDDQYEWECKQRQLQREQRHRERLERDRLRSMSPPPIVHYTEHEASNISDKLKNDETFIKAVQTLITWLERGDCNKKNSNTFYSMIQSTNAHVRRLQNDKQQHEEDLKRAREHYRKQMLSMTQQFTQIEKVFSAASHKKVWDHFTKAQRKNIDLWKKQSTEIRCVQIEDDEMEMSDDDRDYKSSTTKRAKYDNESLKEENDSLRCQLEAYKNEMNLVKSDIKSDSDIREKQIKVLQETIRNLQTQLIENKMKEKEFTAKITDLEDKLKQASVKELLLKTKIVEANAKNSSRSSEYDESEKSLLTELPTTTTSTGPTGPTGPTGTTVVTGGVSGGTGPAEDESSNLNRINSNCDNNSTLVTSTLPTTQIKTDQQLNENEAKLIGLISTFLIIHPFGASPDYICSYLQKIQPNLRLRDLEELLQRYKSLFCEEITGIGAKIERKWKFCGFDTILDTKID